MHANMVNSMCNHGEKLDHLQLSNARLHHACKWDVKACHKVVSVHHYVNEGAAQEPDTSAI